jgi:hypothetical protein
LSEIEKSHGFCWFSTPPPLLLNIEPWFLPLKLPVFDQVGELELLRTRLAILSEKPQGAPAAERIHMAPAPASATPSMLGRVHVLPEVFGRVKIIKHHKTR